MKYASNNIRNILIAGHAGSGKTTLTEALVYFSGAAERMGRVEDGTTVSDFDPEEAKRKASLSASVVPVEYEGIKYNLIDAPGLFDFEAGEYEGIRAAESVLVVVSGRSGVTVGAEKAFQLARKNGKATMVFVSKCDLENANYFKILEDMKIKFGSTVCPCVVPAKLDDGTPVYINLFSQKAFKYEGGKQIQVDLPDIGHRFQGLIEAMSEAIAETDDELMEKFFGGEAFTTEEIVEGMRKGVKDGLITPVFCGSAVNQQALDMLLFNMHKLLPSPEHEASTLAEDAAGEPVELHCTVDEPTAAYVFKTVADPFVGKLSYLRVVSGKVTAGEPLTNARTGDVEKISKPLTVIGKKQVDSDGIIAGDIGAVAKLVSAKTGDTLCDAERVVKLPAPVFPKPSLFMAVTVAKKGDEGKISSALAGEIRRMGEMACAQLSAALDVVDKRDDKAAERIIANDEAIDALEREVSHDVMRLALRGPLAADLRIILAALRISADIERIGDYAANVAKRSLTLNRTPPLPHTRGLRSLGELALQQVRDVLTAYQELDETAALRVRARDAELDAQYTSLFRELLTYMMEDAHSITPCTHLLFMAKNLERIGDHATNIAENIWFLIHGEELMAPRDKRDDTNSVVV